MIVSNGAAQGSRPYQEDYHAYYTPPSGMEARGSLFLLADGMGGMAGGSTASLMAVEYFKNRYYQDAEGTPARASIQDVLAELMLGANRELTEAGLRDPSLRGMGTTLIACVIAGNELHHVSVGDSHLYLLREGALTLLNEDHSVGGQVKTLLAKGEISPDEAFRYEGQAHKLVHYLGNMNFGHFDRRYEPLCLFPGDIIILCSDGLYGTLSDDEISSVIASTPLEEAAGALIRETLSRKTPNQDNLTVQIIAIGPSSNTAPLEPSDMQEAGRSIAVSGSRMAVAIALVLALGTAVLAYTVLKDSSSVKQDTTVPAGQPVLTEPPPQVAEPGQSSEAETSDQAQPKTAKGKSKGQDYQEGEEARAKDSTAKDVQTKRKK